MEPYTGTTAVADLANHFDRYVVRLVEEIEAYPDERALWQLQPGILNSAGTLTLHIIGNLKHWIGAKLGGSDYVRDREAEFSDLDVPRAELLWRLQETREVVATALAGVEDDALGEPFPGVHDHYAGATVSWFLIHLAIHLGYHVGQVNYHRRLLTTEPLA